MCYGRPHNMVNFSQLEAEIGWRVCGTPANFNRFGVLVSLFNGGQSNFGRCLTVSWAGTQYIHFLRLFSSNGILPGVKFTLRPNVGFCYIDSVTARHSSCGRAGVWRLSLIMAALCNRGAIIFLPCDFYLSFLFLLSSFFFSSPNLSGHRLDLYHTSTHGVAQVRI